jgi:hypothetical protein
MHNFSVLNSRGKVNAITEIHNLNANELVLSPEGSEVIYKQPRILQNLDPTDHRYGAGANLHAQQYSDYFNACDI